MTKVVSVCRSLCKASDQAYAELLDEIDRGGIRLHVFELRRLNRMFPHPIKGWKTTGYRSLDGLDIYIEKTSMANSVHLLMHELTHSVQANSGLDLRSPGIEDEAERIGFRFYKRYQRSVGK